MKDQVRYITVDEASRRTNVPIMRIISLILLDKVNGIVISNKDAVLQESELQYIK